MRLFREHLPLVISLLLGVGGVWASWAVASDHIQQHAARIEKLESKQDATEREHAEQHTAVEVLKQTVTSMADMVKEIRSDVKELRRR